MYLLDTCVYSEFTRPRPSAAVVAWARSVQESDHYLSVLVIGELLRGVARLPSSRRRSGLEHWIETLLVTHKPRIIAVETDVVRQWAALCAKARQRGVSPGAIDSLIAAQVKTHGLTLVTRNTSDFASFEIPILNPWETAETPPR